MDLQITEADVADDETVAAAYDVQRSGVLAGRRSSPFWSLPEFVATWRGVDPGERSVLLAGRREGGVVATGEYHLSLHDNLHKAWIDVAVHPDHQHQGVGRAMLADVVGRVAAEGRTELLTETLVPFADLETHRHRRFAEAAAFSYANVEVVRHLALPVAATDLDRWSADAATRHAGYRIETYLDDTVPEGYVASLCVLLGQLGVDAPTGTTEWEEEAMTPERFHANRAATIAGGRTAYETIAIAPDGTVAAQTTLMAPPAPRTDASQWGTFVHREHRGHRLGLAVKAANLRRLQADRPDLRRAYTQNAETNQWMIAVNELMGFRPVEASLELSRRLERG